MTIPCNRTEVIGQPAGIRPFLPPHGSQELNSGPQGWWKAILLPELSCQCIGKIPFRPCKYPCPSVSRPPPAPPFCYIVLFWGQRAGSLLQREFLFLFTQVRKPLQSQCHAQGIHMLLQRLILIMKPPGGL